jgi:hypothetical protein
MNAAQYRAALNRMQAQQRAAARRVQQAADAEFRRREREHRLAVAAAERAAKRAIRGH